MDQLQKIFKSLSRGQRVGILVAALLVIAGLTSFVRWRHESDFRPLFSGMPAEDAAAIVQKLKEFGVEHGLTDSATSVLVPAEKVDELRLEMAGAGLPRSGRIGFELFDKTNLGITDFTEHVNYRRALEGELERSIRSLNEVEQARVHSSFPKESVFLDAREPAKASVLLSLRPAAHLSDSNVQAITNLVASAVEGLNPEFVSVVDMRGTLLSRPKRSGPDSGDGSDATLEYRHQLEKDLVAKIQSTLTPLLGEDHFRVGIYADCDFSTSEQTEESFDPTRSVMTNSQKSEDISSRPDSSGVPGTPSNSPRPVSRPAIAASSISRRTENNSYETSRTVREGKVPREVIKRLSASILIDNETHWQGTGPKAKRITVPPDPARIQAIHDIVAGIIGFSSTRGDQLIVQSLPFQQSVMDEPGADLPKSVPPEEDWHKFLHDPKILGGAGAGILVLLALVVLLLKRNKKQQEMVSSGPAQLSAADTPGAKGTPEGASNPDTAQLSGHAAKALGPPVAGVQIDTLRQNIWESVVRDPAVAAGVIRAWIAESEA